MQSIACPQVPVDGGDFDIVADVTTPSKTCWWRPLHPLLILAIIPLCPSWFFLNRGYTQWFHWCFIFYLMTGKDHWLRFVVLVGGSVSAGWYLAVAHEYWTYNRFCHLLYNNMPGSFRAVMLTDGNLASGGILLDSAPAVATILMAHCIDLLMHPYLTYAVWKMHTRRGGTLRTLVTWDVIAATYMFSRFYSVTHQFYNNGAIDGFFYYGHDVYRMDNQESYTAAYVGEAVFYAGLICYKLYFQAGLHLRWKVSMEKTANNIRRSSKSMSPKQMKEFCVEDKLKPELIQSDSCVSTSSSMDQ